MLYVYVRLWLHNCKARLTVMQGMLYEYISQEKNG